MGRPLFRSADELNAHPELFRDPQRTDEENRGPFLIVQDGFYDDPHAVRALAIEQEFYQYRPPTADQVGAEEAARYVGQRPRWLASALLRSGGKVVAHPKPGFRHAPPEGTTIWRSKATGLCVATARRRHSTHAYDDFEQTLVVENRFNRLIHFREHVLHRAEKGFGSTVQDGRMSQTFFFQSER